MSVPAPTGLKHIEILSDMPVTVYYHGILADIAHRFDDEYDPVGSTENLLKQFYEKYPAAKQYVFRVAVNNRIISGKSPVSDGDTIDLIPPFPGG